MAIAKRYSNVAILLHWVIALLIVLLIPMGWWMTNAIEAGPDQALAYRAYQVHKALGFLILALTVIRIAWRLGHPAPPLPRDMKAWEIVAARATHSSFYILLLALPLSGWVYVSSGWAVGRDSELIVPTSWFGLFSVPHLEFITALGEDARRAIAFRSSGAHEILAWGVVALLALHIAAALKHHLVDKDGVLKSMLPVRSRTSDVDLSSDLQEDPASTQQDHAMKRKYSSALFAGGAAVAALVLAGAVTHSPPVRQIADTVEEPVKLQSAPTRSASQDDAADQDEPVQNAAEESAAAEAADSANMWTVDPAASAIRFAGTHADSQFAGSFSNWKAKIKFDPSDLEGSMARIEILTGSARTGDPTQEGSLKGDEWFDPDHYPTAYFWTDRFIALGGNRYQAIGTLKIKTVTVPVTLPFTFSGQDDVATVKGKVVLDRIALKLGLVSDATAQWVSKDINVEIEVRARRAQ